MDILLTAIGLILLGGAIVFFRQKYNLDLLQAADKAREIRDVAIEFGIGVAEQTAQEALKDGKAKPKPEEKENLAIQVAKEFAENEAKKYGKSVAKKVGSEIVDMGKGLGKSLIKSKLGLGKLGKIF